MRIQVPPFRRYGNPSAIKPPEPPIPRSAIKITNIDGTANNAVLFPHVPEIEITTGNFSINFWFHIAQLPPDQQTILPWGKMNSDFTNADAQYLIIGGTDTSAMNGIFDVTNTVGSLDVTADPLDASDWVSIGLRKGNTGNSILLNGVEAGFTASTDPLESLSDTFFALFYVGVTGPADPVPCEMYMADFRFYTAALSDAQFLDLANMIDVTSNLSTRVKFDNNCDDSVGDMNGTAGSGVEYADGPPGLPA